MDIISLDMRGLSHATMAMCCAKEGKVIVQLKESALDNFVRLQTLLKIRVVRITKRLFAQSHTT